MKRHHYTKQAILDMDQRYRANFINCLSGFKSLNLVGTQNAQGQTNLAPFSSVVHLGAHPALVGMVSRPDSVDRHTIGNILDTGEYSLNHVTQDMAAQAHQCSARYDLDESEFDATGLPLARVDGFIAPCVESAPLTMMVKYREHHRLDINNTLFIIGEIQSVLTDDAVVRDSGYVDLEALGTVTCSGLDSYHTTERIDRYAYAKVGVELKAINDKA